MLRSYASRNFDEQDMPNDPVLMEVSEKKNKLTINVNGRSTLEFENELATWDD